MVTFFKNRSVYSITQFLFFGFGLFLFIELALESKNINTWLEIVITFIPFVFLTTENSSALLKIWISN